MIGLLGLVLPGSAWLWKWGAIAAVSAAFGGWCWLQGAHHVEREFDKFRLEVQAVGDRQNRETAARVAAWQTLKETTDAQAQDRAARDAVLLAASRKQLLDFSARVRLVPSAAAGAGDDKRICFADRDELDREIGAALLEFAAEDLGDAAEGQRGIAVASACQAWAQGLAR